MTRNRTLFATACLASALALAPAAGAQEIATSFRITFTNLTQAQVASPPIVVTHNIQANVFRVGEPASDGLAAVAEDADASALVDALEASPDVFQVVVGDEGGPIPPGASRTLEIDSTTAFPRLSVVGMLVQTNDAFYGIDSFPLAGPWRQVIYAPAYDAGTEENNELCAFIPGPPCGNAFVRATENAEGFVYIHSGYRGVGDLDPNRYDWRNPTMQVRIVRLPNG